QLIGQRLFLVTGQTISADQQVHGRIAIMDRKKESIREAGIRTASVRPLPDEEYLAQTAQQRRMALLVKRQG
ncbi:MAG: hypothetical protein AAGH65_10755, partial [Pseudomonadota bacterium]